MQILYGLMILAGLVAIVIGFKEAYGDKKPWDIIGSITLPVGLIICLLGILLTCVPNFFKG